MAKYLISKPTYVQGVHLGAQATLANPVAIELPDDVEPSVTWAPMDEAALKNLNRAVERLAERRCVNFDPSKDKFKIEQTVAQTKAEFKKVLVQPVAPKPVPREADTMQGVAAAGRNVVGRASDKSPV